MKQLPSHSIDAKGIGDHNSISNGPDDGANGNLRRLFWNSMGHSTTQEAVNNFLSRLPLSVTEEAFKGAGNLNLGGHGNEGFLETGSGQHGQQDYKTNYMTDWNKFIWDPICSALKSKNFPILYIYSCHTGAGERGADFLFELAKTIGKPAAGRTGFLYSNNQKFWFEDRSVWQVATPDTRPTPISAPTPHFAEVEMENFTIEAEGKEVAISADAVLSVTVSSAIKRAIPLSKDLIRPLFSVLFGSDAHTLPGAPSAMITSKIEISFALPSGGQENRTFVVFNDRLVVDQVGQLAYYVRPGFVSFVSSL